MTHPFQGEFRRFRPLIHRGGARRRLPTYNLWIGQPRKPSLKASDATLAGMLVPALTLALLLASGLVLGLGLGVSAEAGAEPGRGTGLV